mmetsp:Transcript_76046/g.150371  ORF Transcript_76046/g.150371 Transcript_76046/m.150371 type:complete len:224 (+) Transcript_76046:135-806(+)|eukprot:CAMPEP_0172698888 /NCGR_PEP_ID=MMETSP1074-20121228/29787_1 /TAXON_ID=2916 /ORGANISM="Ceratium fusus, Strain PA161109" /LENGTH=223 /DNA_ID=CAMNT_0013519993 /DNA_START=65 /DNA_END=736 /DNA_ORIENTATION=-
MGAAFAKDDDDEFADLGAKVTGATRSVQVFRALPQELSSISELSTAPSTQQLELPVLKLPKLTMTSGYSAKSPPVKASKNEFRCCGPADSFHLLCADFGEEKDFAKKQCPFQLCGNPSGFGNGWAVPQEVVECDMEPSPRQRLALDTVPRTSGNGSGHVQKMSLTHEPLQSHRGIKNQQHKESTAALAKRNRANAKADGGARSLHSYNGSSRKQNPGWISCVM